VKPWSKVPTWWYRAPPTPYPELGVVDGLMLSSVFARLRGGNQAGASQAALRVVLGLASADRKADTFEVVASLDDLEKLTELSRSMVLKGIALAVKHGFITYTPGRPREKSRFLLLQAEGDGAGGWAKLPNEQTRTRIPKIPHRGDVGLAALKIYLTLLAARPNDNTVLALRHETLRFKTGCQTKHVRAAISLLANEGLIHVIREEDPIDPAYKAQQYQICGKLDAPRKWGEPRSAPIESPM